MTTQLQNLAQRIHTELSDLARVIKRVELGWEGAKRSNDDFYLDSVALNLHGFYSGVETLFELIASRVDYQKPTGASWHQHLLQQMSGEIPSVRPAVISESVAVQLDEYRSFRHVVRHVYSFRFDATKMARLVDNLPPLFAELHVELTAFAHFLTERNL